MSDLTVTTFTSTTGTRSIDFTTGNIIVSNNAGGTLVNINATTLTVIGANTGNGIDVRNSGSTATTITMPATTEANSINLKVSQGTYALTLTTSVSIRTLDFTGFSGSLATNPALAIYGDLKFASGMTTFLSGANTWSMSSTDATERTITFAGKSINFPIAIVSNPATGSFKFLDTVSFSVGREIAIQGGTVDFNNQTITGATGVTVQVARNSVVKNLSMSLPLTINSSGILILGSNITVGAFSLTLGTINLDTYTCTVNTLSYSGAGLKTLNFGTSGKFVINNSAGGAIYTGTASGLTVSGTNPLVECIGGTSAGAITKSIGTGNQTESTAISFSLLDTSSSVSYSFTGSSPNAVRNLLINGTQTFNNTAMTIFGNYTYDDSSGTKVTAFTTGINAWTFASTSGTARNITVTATGTVDHDFPWIFNGVAGSWMLQSAVSVGIANSRSVTLTNGTLDLNGYTFTMGQFVTAAGTKSLIFDGGTVSISGAGATAWNNAAPTGFTNTAGTGVGTISMSSSSAKTFVGASIVYNAKLNQAGTGTLTVTGSNTFDDLSASISSTANSTISFPASTTTTFNNFTLTGTSTYKPVINSSTVGTRATLYNAAALSGFVTGIDYIQAQDIQFSPGGVTDGTDYWRWYLGANSVSLDNNLGGVFQTYNAGTSRKVYVLTTGVSWPVPSDFNVSNNNIYIYGAGGGGGGGGNAQTSTTRAAGAGGGGGGYVKLTNFVGYANSTIGYSVGAGGAGGAILSNGSPGGNTTFKTTTARGGGGGQGGAAGVTSTTGGAGGTGSTANGGAGGNSGGTVNQWSGGGGGGGAGGENGTGGAGGIGFSSTTSGQAAGGGGGGSGGGTAGSAGVSTIGGAGGNNFAGAGGGAAATANGNPGFSGGGGSGAAALNITAVGGNGSDAADVLNTIGSGGGGGGGASRNGSIQDQSGGSGGYGAGGGGGGGGNATGNPGQGGAGGSGLIVIAYFPGTAPEPPVISGTSSFFMMFN